MLQLYYFFNFYLLIDKIGKYVRSVLVINFCKLLLCDANSSLIIDLCLSRKILSLLSSCFFFCVIVIKVVFKFICLGDIGAIFLWLKVYKK